MDNNKKFELLKRNTQEIITEKDLKTLLKTKKNPSMYIGISITGKPHIGYFVWCRKLADFLKAGFKVKVLLADLHGALDNTPWEVLEKRYKYYAKVIPMMISVFGVDLQKLEIVKGSDFQLNKNYFLDVLKMSSYTSVNDCIRASSEVVKQGLHPKLSGLIYPIMQSLDEEYLDVDLQYGGLDQRKILVFARENLPKIGYRQRVEIMTPLLPGLISKKMSASNPKSKIDLLDSEKEVDLKINNAQCVAGNPDNFLMGFLRTVIFVDKKKFVIERPKKYGGNLVFESYSEIEKSFIDKKLHPMDLKKAVAKEINIMLESFRKKHSVLNKFAQDAY